MERKQVTKKDKATIPNEKECFVFLDENGIILLQFRTFFAKFPKKYKRFWNKVTKKDKDTIPTSEKNQKETEFYKGYKERNQTKKPFFQPKRT